MSGTDELVIHKAERRRARLRLALLGPTGSGKTYSALQLAMGIAPGGKIGIIDTENGSADLYAHLCEYDVITLGAPFTVMKYRQAIKMFERTKYDIIIIDSLTHAWTGEGGLLDRSGQAQKRGENSFTAWRDITPDHNRLVDDLLQSPAHIICTMRVKTEYVLEKNDRGKMVPRKVGLQPVQRDGMEYEFTLVMDVDTDHMASASKDRTTLFSGWHNTLTPEVGGRLLHWLNAGKAEDAPPTIVTPPKPSADEWYAKQHARLSAMTTSAEVEEYMHSKMVQAALGAADENARREINNMIGEALERTLAKEAEANGHDHEAELGAAGEP